MSTNQPSGHRYRATLTAALTLSLTGRYRRQGNEAAAGIRLWADAESVQLTLVDDGGVAEAAVEAYTSLLGKVDLLIGPYSSGLVRAIAPHLRRAGQLLWNHGGSADDLVQPGVAFCLRRHRRNSMASWTKRSPAKSTSWSSRVNERAVVGGRINN